jgi:DNA-binding MarR family transcriptional regulator
LVLTRKGKVELKRYQELARACDSAFSKGLSSDERKELLRLLRKLRVLHAPDAIGIE